MTFDITVGRHFPVFLSRINGKGYRSAQVLKQEAEEIGSEAKDVAEYVKQHQALDGEEGEAWREALKI